MGILIDLPKYSINPITTVDDEESGGVDMVRDTVVGGSNPMMSVQDAHKKRPMGRKNAAKNGSKSADTSNSPSESTRILEALEQKNELKKISHCHCLW